MDNLATEYLPNWQERIEHLRNIIGGRSVAILAGGSSIINLEKRINELADADICYFGMNSYIVQEEPILGKIDKYMSVVMLSGREGMPPGMKDILSFLDRNENNMFVSSFYRDTFGLMPQSFNLGRFLDKYDRKLLFFSLISGKQYPKNNRPLHFLVSNTLLVLIQLAIIGKASRVVLFGGDGGCQQNAKEWYYRHWDNNHAGAYNGEYRVAPLENILRDTNLYFNPVAPIALRNVYNTYGLEPIEILNCSENSLYTPFPIVSYNDAFAVLLTNRKGAKNFDLRVPKVSIITIYSKHDSQETSDNIKQQSYTNYEHIVVNDKLPMKALSKGVAIARGEYLCFCRVGNGYLNRDWLNSCVDIMENDKTISLVWGLTQKKLADGSLSRIEAYQLFNEPPAQGKEYIYDWLKRNLIFPESNICIRKKVFEACFNCEAPSEIEAWTDFNYKFNYAGYLPYYLPIVVSCSYYDDNSDAQDKALQTIYRDKISKYKEELILGKIRHCYRDSAGNELVDGFKKDTFYLFEVYKLLKRKAPFLMKIIEKWQKYHWRIIWLGIRKITRAYI